MDLIVSANDAKLVRSAGRDSFPEQAAPDTLTLIDAAQFPPRVLAIAEVATSIAGPPQAVALAPNGRVAIVSASNHYDSAAGKQVFDPLLQVVDLSKRPPRVVRRVDVGHHPQGVAINRDGTLLLAATTGGTVAVLTLHETAVELIDRLELADGRLAGVSFTHDGRHALVALRDAQGVAVLAVEGTRVRDTGERVSTGVAPYAIDVSGDGRWAVVGNVGLAGLSAPAARLC
ncbi:MAG TPA: YncE family protein, partial [Burkholderiaceae bacterium]|nr:YncE family protein [Burkholderiaceae bacterium]